VFGQNYLEQLREKGYKLTTQRRQIIEALSQMGPRVGAREIYDNIKGKNPSLSLDTVYRNLRLLTEIGVVHQISLQSGTLFEFMNEACHHHLVCIDCEKVVCIPYCPDPDTYISQATEAGFSVLGHSFEVYGRCTDCRK
jgi:Fe2+ or Zn2+ uptake regulation protein